MELITSSSVNIENSTVLESKMSDNTNLYVYLPVGISLFVLFILVVIFVYKNKNTKISPPIKINKVYIENSSDIYEEPVINDSYYDQNTLIALSNNKNYVIPLESNYDYFGNNGYETPVVSETSYELANSEQSNNYELAKGCSSNNYELANSEQSNNYELAKGCSSNNYELANSEQSNNYELSKGFSSNNYELAKNTEDLFGFDDRPNGYIDVSK
jgi:hypothetical protein